VVTVAADQAGNANYFAAPTVDQSFTIAKANQTITVTTSAPNSAFYGTNFTVAATASSGLGVSITASGSGSGSGTGSATVQMTSGTGTANVTFTQAGNANYNAATAVIENVTAQKATPIITWALASIPYGKALSGTQLDATSSWTVGGVSRSVAGTFTYTPLAGTVLGAGSQTLSVSFTPTDATDYTGAAATTTIQVLWNGNVYVNAAWAGDALDTAVTWTDGTTHYVGYDAFGTVQAGVTAVAAGSTVSVAAGTYTEQVTVSKSLTLIGAGASTTTIKAPSKAPSTATLGDEVSIPWIHDRDFRRVCHRQPDPGRHRRQRQHALGHRHRRQRLRGRHPGPRWRDLHDHRQRAHRRRRRHPGGQRRERHQHGDRH